MSVSPSMRKYNASLHKELITHDLTIIRTEM